MDETTTITATLTYDEGKTISAAIVVGTTPPGLSGLDLSAIVPKGANLAKTVWEVRSSAGDVPIRCEVLAETVHAVGLEVKATAGALAVTVDVTATGPEGPVKESGMTGQTITLAGFA